jgi:CubicO group peptidase (beta-lactamase class C family)
MKIVKILVGTVVFLALCVAVVTYGIYDRHEPIADLARETHVDAAIYDTSYAAPIDLVRGRLIDAREQLVAPAFSLAVNIDGKLIWAEAHGVTDVGTGNPVSLTSRFPIGSVSKTIAAVAAALLAEQGLLDLDTDFSYSSYGYTLVSAVIVAASGEEFLGYLQRVLFDPLTMDQTQADYADRPVANRVSGYISRFSRSAVLREPENNSSYKWAGGGLLSTPSDLANFGSALLKGNLLQPQTLEVMFTPRTISSGEINPQHYGLGWRIGGMYYPRDTEEIITMINHGGTAMGAISVLILMPDSGLVLAMTANSVGVNGSGALMGQAAAIIGIFLDHM